MARNLEEQQEHPRRAKATNVVRERPKPVGLRVRGRLGTCSGFGDSIRHAIDAFMDIAGGQPTWVLSMDETMFDGALRRNQCRQSRHGTLSLSGFSISHLLVVYFHLIFYMRYSLQHR